MSGSSVTEAGQCPCGLPYEDVRDLRLVGAGGVCTALDENGSPCGRRLADHPHTQAGKPMICYFFHSCSFIRCRLFVPMNFSPRTLAQQFSHQVRNHTQLAKTMRFNSIIVQLFRFDYFRSSRWWSQFFRES